MPQITQGIRSILSLPSMYRLFGALIGGSYSRATLVKEYVKPSPGDRILDIGCGTGDILYHLPDVQYIGFDTSEAYIRAARQQFGDRATFYCDTVGGETTNPQTLQNQPEFDIVLAVGILHHLNDAEAVQLCKFARTVLKPGGRLVTFDGCYVKGQSALAHYILSKDRGQNVRSQEGYRAIASPVFSTVTVSIRHDLLRIPYTHIILNCVK